MTQRSRTWLAVALLLFLVLNLGGTVYAAAQGEPPHAGLHAGLTLLAAYLLWRLAPMRSARGDRHRAEEPVPAVSTELTDRLGHLEQSVDTVAIEVERIGEGQRYMAHILTENGRPQMPGERAAEPVDVPDAVSPARHS